MNEPPDPIDRSLSVPHEAGPRTDLGGGVSGANATGPEFGRTPLEGKANADGEPTPSPMRSIHTSNFASILNQIGCSLLVTTYQAGRLVVVRPDGDVINTHFRMMRKPMGLALGYDRFSVGTAQEIWEFRNVPAVCPRLKPPEKKYDACFLPRDIHVTGDIQIHEMHYRGHELWFINTTFSCLCTFEREHSFVPRWRPRFVSQYAPGDRCHLNGLAFRDGNPRYATALGETDTPGGWRANKKNGGVLIDIESNDIITRNLSMPHSPRWYRGRLWLLESGTGSFGFIHPDTGAYEAIAQFPGFTRGIDFVANLAFIGLSQVRESAIFSGFELTERLPAEERTCGIWVVDIRDGSTVAFLKFQDAVQEIFAVVAVVGARYPEIILDEPEISGSSYVLPDAALREVPPELLAENLKNHLAAGPAKLA